MAKCVQTQTIRIYRLHLSNVKDVSNVMVVTKHHFAPSEVISRSFVEGARYHTEIFYDTPSWDLAMRGFWWKCISSQNHDQFHQLKIIEAVSPGGDIQCRQMEASSEKIIENELQNLFSDWHSLSDKIQPQATLLVQRIQSPQDDFQLRYDVVEYPEGDIYAVASTYSTSKEDKSQSFLKKISAMDCNSKIVEYLSRYQKTVYETLVENNKVKRYASTDFDVLDNIVESHPSSITRTSKWIEEQALTAYLMEHKLSREEYNQMQKEFEIDL